MAYSLAFGHTNTNFTGIFCIAWLHLSLSTTAVSAEVTITYSRFCAGHGII